MRRGVFQRILLLYAAVILVAFLFIELSITAAIRDQHIADLRQSLVVQAALVADRIASGRPVAIEVLCRESKERTGARVTVIARDGRVIADSDVPSRSLENHAERPEIRQAADEGAGMSIRRSETLNQDLLYVAYRAPSDSPIDGYVRLSLPLQEVDRAVQAARLRIILIVGFVIAATGAYSFWQFEYLRRLTRRVKDFAGSLVPRGIGQRLFLQDAGEFSDIADSLNTMSEELRTVIGAHEQERKRLNDILQNIPDALIVLSDRGVVQLASAATRDFFGDVPLIDRPFIQVVRNSGFVSLLDEVRAGGAAGVSELRLEHPVERYCVVRISPLYLNAGILSGFVAVFHDITELKKTEQVRKDFVANASHEIKTPITAIQGFADTLIEGALNDREHAVQFLQAIRSNSGRINRLVDDLMTISRIEMGVIKIEKLPVRFSEAAEAVRAMLKDRADARGLSLRVIAAPGMSDIAADRDRLIQILTNLVENGIKFTERGGVTFGIGEEGGRRVIFVEDTGMGIPKQHLSRLGERFYRVDPSRSRQMGGTGLGLAIVKHLVKAHGWDLRIESEQEKGTKVTIVVG